jgi:ADP-heptose:LPS heptosyltransferase
MTIDKTQVKRILVITLSNVGDIILTTPVIRVLSKEFPAARMDVVVGPSGKEIFDKDPRISKLIIYDKHVSLLEKRRMQLKLKKLKYDMVVDLRNTVLPLLLGSRYRTNPMQTFPKTVLHRKHKHLYRLHCLDMHNLDENSYIYIPEEDEKHTEDLIRKSGICEPVIAINPGAKSHLKRWTVEAFAELADRLISECKASVVFIGLKEDKDIVSAIMKKMRQRAHDFVDKTNIRQLASLLKRAKLLITNDSAPLHLGCAVGTRVLSIFGPTDPEKYGPTGEFDVVVNKKLFCSPCESAECKQGHECMKLISADEVYEAAKIMVEGYE